MSDTEVPLSDEQRQASAVQFLLDGGENDAASVLLACEMQLEVYTEDNWNGTREMVAQMSGPREAYDILRKPNHDVHVQIVRALSAVLSWGDTLRGIEVRAASTSVPPDWRKTLLEAARSGNVTNQGVTDNSPRVTTWNGLRFRSESEKRIAAALDREGVLYLPNCRARLGLPDARLNREPDFLVCLGGKWGILEVDGEPFHPPSRTVADHERDRLFQQHGILIAQHFDANRCYEAPQAVVKEFLQILRQS